MKGKLIMVDGLDASGKGVIIDTVGELAREKGMRVFDLRTFYKENHRIPDFEEVQDHDVFLSCEPTYSWCGAAIRNELVRPGGRTYSALSTAQAFSLDREILYKKLLVPLLHSGKIIFQERGVVTSIVFQPLHAAQHSQTLTHDQVLSFPGNKFCLQEYPPTVLVITKCSAEAAMERLHQRTHKDDHCEFEKLPFQKQVEEVYRSTWLKELFEKQGTKVVYIDTDHPKTVEHTKKAAEDLAHQFL